MKLLDFPVFCDHGKITNFDTTQTAQTWWQVSMSSFIPLTTISTSSSCLKQVNQSHFLKLITKFEHQLKWTSQLYLLVKLQTITKLMCSAYTTCLWLVTELVMVTASCFLKTSFLIVFSKSYLKKKTTILNKLQEVLIFSWHVFL